MISVSNGSEHDDRRNAGLNVAAEKKARRVTLAAGQEDLMDASWCALEMVPSTVAAAM